MAFIDFKKAFDSISRTLLWPIPKKNGIREKLFDCVKVCCGKNVMARVRYGALLAYCIECLRGVKQGDVCSPVLFSLLNELALDIFNGGKHGAW